MLNERRRKVQMMVHRAERNSEAAVCGAILTRNMVIYDLSNPRKPPNAFFSDSFLIKDERLQRLFGPKYKKDQGRQMHFLKSYKFSTHCAVCDIKMSGNGIKFAVCRLHSENAKWITDDDVLYTKKLNMRRRTKCHHCHFYLLAGWHRLQRRSRCQTIGSEFHCSPSHSKTWEHSFRDFATFFFGFFLSPPIFHLRCQKNHRVCSQPEASCWCEG